MTAETINDYICLTIIILAGLMLLGVTFIAAKTYDKN